MTSKSERPLMPVERLSVLPYIDERLGKAKKIVERAFAIPRSREELTPQFIVTTSILVQNAVADELGVPREALRLPTVETVEDVTEGLRGRGGARVSIRHAAQQSDTDNKIRRMQLPRNLEDFLTPAAIAESAGMATAMALILQKIGKNGRVHTSQNNRAAEVAILLAAAMGTTAGHDRILDCVNYRTDLSDEELDAMIGPENKGSAQWDKRIDDICAQPGLYHNMNTDMARYAGGDLMHNEDDLVYLEVTHTQQNQAEALAFNPNEVPIRHDELGFRLVRKTGRYGVPTTKLFLPGLYKGK